MEGPYLSPEDGARGAHPREHIARRQPRRLQPPAGRRRRPDRARHARAEVPGAPPLIEHLVATGVRVAIGHTAATPTQIADAIAAGATMATHLGNGCAQMLPRHPNVIWELLAADDVFASLIVGRPSPPAGDGEGDGPREGADADDSRHRCGRGRRLRRRDATRSAAHVRVGRGRPRLDAGNAVSRRILLTLDRAIANTVQVHRPVDRRGRSDGVDHSRGFSRHDDAGNGDRRVGPRAGGAAVRSVTTCPI